MLTSIVVIPGLPADSSWVLHGPENDRTLGMRNWMAYWTSRQMGRYASRTVYYEMFLNTVITPRVLHASCSSSGIQTLQYHGLIVFHASHDDPSIC